MKKWIVALIFPVLSLNAQPAGADKRPLPRLQVSENRRFLVNADGKPFFYLGDTAWELFHRLNREDATRYLENRARKGFTVIQAVALAELDGLNDPNPYGHRPLVDNDPLRPDDGPGRGKDARNRLGVVAQDRDPSSEVQGVGRPHPGA